MYVKITTDCAFMGCETTRLVKVDDDSTEDFLQEIADDFLQSDVCPEACYEILDDEQVDEEIDNGLDIIDMTSEEE